MSSKEAGKARIYTGQRILPSNYNSFTRDQRAFWKKAEKSFARGDMYFMYNKVNHIVPFRFADGSFDTVLTAEKLTKNFEEAKELQENIKNQKDEQDGQPNDGGQVSTVDTVVASIE